ncbi:MAG: sulfatase-like hydrolase/transferase [Planctomycetota bacterium]
MHRRPVILLATFVALFTGILRGQDPARERAIQRKLSLTPKKEQDAIYSHAATWLTGGSAENDYVSVGRLANYFGFVAFRVSSDFSISRGGVGQRAYAILDPSQREKLVRLLDEQWPKLIACEEARVAINRALEGLLVGRAATMEAVERLGVAFGRAESELGLVLARGFCAIAATLTDAQREQFAAVRRDGLAGQLAAFHLDGPTRNALSGLAGDISGRRGQELWNLASNLLTWTTGTPEADDYDSVGKPSQHFGFVDLRIESGHAITRGGVADRMRELLDAPQREGLESVVIANEADFAGFFAARRDINREFEGGLAGRSIDPGKTLAAGEAQGRAEARMTWRQAAAYLALRDSLTPEQTAALVQLREHLVIPKTGQAAHPGADRDVGDDALAASNPAADGERLFALCALCHLPTGGHRIGPSLDGVLGRPVASVAGFDYSPAMHARGATGETWTRERLDAFLRAPMQDTPGTRMPFAGIPDRAQRSALLDHLATLSRAPTAAQTPVATTTPVASSKVRPNFVVVLIEGTGAGWSSTSVAMDDTLPDAHAASDFTPTLTRLAHDGMRFARFYADSPRCTPSRAALFTGQSPARLHITYVSEGGEQRGGGRRGGGRDGNDANSEPRRLSPATSLQELPPAATTVAEMLHGSGWTTAHFGKWHVGRASPATHGFDQQDGANTNQGPGRDRTPNPEQAETITTRGLAFARAARDAHQPFYLQLSHYGGGTEDESRPETRALLAAELRGMRGKSAWQAAILRDIDDRIAELLHGLDELGLSDSTYVFVTFDHGAAGRDGNAPLRGGKGSVLEGGIRVPLLVRGPGVTAGACSHVRASLVDILPTIADLAGTRKPEGPLDGGSLRTVLEAGGKGEVVRADADLIVHFPHWDLGNGGPQSAIFSGDYKLVRRDEDGARQLFDIAHDPGELEDLAAAQPERVTDLEHRLDHWLDAVHAARATPDPKAGKKGEH